MGATDRVPAFGLWLYARDYAEAAGIVQAEKHEKIFMPCYYLYCHAIELALKALLRCAGYTIKQFIDIGHDLDELLEAAQNSGLADCLPKLDPDQFKAIKSANAYYRSKDFEYIMAGTKHLPTIGILGSCAQQLVAFTKQECEKSRQKRHPT